MISVWYCWSIILLWRWGWWRHEYWYCPVLIWLPVAAEIQMWQRENTVVISGPRFWIHYRLSVMRSDHYLDTTAAAKLPGYSRKTHFCTIWRNRLRRAEPDEEIMLWVSHYVPLGLTVSRWFSLTNSHLEVWTEQTDRPIGQTVHLDWWIKIRSSQLKLYQLPTTTMWPT